MIEVDIKGKHFQFAATDRLFCPRHIDAGTLAMLSAVDFANESQVLDLGCGYGVVGIVAAHFMDPERVWLLDCDESAVHISASNALINGVPNVNLVVSNGFSNLDAIGFSLILCNPPYQADFAVPKHFIEKGFNRLAMGGRMVMVTKRKLWYRNKLISTFGGVRVEEIDGYHVFTAERRTKAYVNGLKKQRR